ncbi:MAG: NAD(P)/FAD-dependent oxidoreductase [Bdellovibrionota bacterium]
MAQFDYDIIIIGAGPAGYAAAMRAWDFGKKICLIEKARVGGVGIYDGALSSKTFWELSQDYCRATRENRGFRAEHITVDYHDVAAAVSAAVAERGEQLVRQLQELQEPIEGSGTIATLMGMASFVDPHTIRVIEAKSGEEKHVTGEHIIIATGSTPRETSNIKCDGEYILTSDHLGNLKDFPKSMVIVGAGVVGCEFATVFANYGKTKVYLIDRAPRILPFEDEDIASLCSTNLETRGVTVHHQAQLKSLQVVGDEVEYEIEHPHGGIEKITVERALLSIGRAPNITGLAIENSGVTLDDKGCIKCESTRTSVPHIYAVGDVTLDVAVVSVAEIEGRHAVEHICGTNPTPISYTNLSSIMFLNPEVAAIGMNEIQAQEAKVPYRVASYGYSLLNRAIAMNATDGFVKVLVTDTDDLQVLGMRALGAQASTVIEAASLMMQQKIGIRALSELLHPHPAITELLQECARMLCGTSINKPQVFRNELRVSKVEQKASAAQPS